MPEMKMPEVGAFLFTSTKTPGKIKEGTYWYKLICYGKPADGKGTLINTTGNRLILTCAIEAVERLTKPCMITIFTDCRYLINSHGQLERWKSADWKRPSGELKNVDLWQRLYKALKRHLVRYRYENMDKYR